MRNRMKNVFDMVQIVGHVGEKVNISPMGSSKRPCYNQLNKKETEQLPHF